jgi:thiamine transport system ATP-binding protein
MSSPRGEHIGIGVGVGVENVSVSFTASAAQVSGDGDGDGDGSAGRDVVLDDVSLSVGDGEVVALLGPSGSGKSTLLRVIAGIIVPDSGRVLVHGVDMTGRPTHRRGVGMVFQDNQLFPHMSVIDNVAFGPKMAGVGRPERNERAAIWLRRVGLSGFEERRVTDLSGGEAKRVALARTLAAEPAVVLLDEPLTGLDRDLHDRLSAELGALLHDAKVTALLVTHDHDEAAAIADRTAQLAEL